jgi:hypothetical protein
MRASGASRLNFELEVLVVDDVEQPRVQPVHKWRVRGAVGEHVDGRVRVGHHDGARANFAYFFIIKTQ